MQILIIQMARVILADVFSFKVRRKSHRFDCVLKIPWRAQEACARLVAAGGGAQHGRSRRLRFSHTILLSTRSPSHPPSTENARNSHRPPLHNTHCIINALMLAKLHQAKYSARARKVKRKVSNHFGDGQVTKTTKKQKKLQPHRTRARIHTTL